jgi:hypothetical protein
MSKNAGPSPVEVIRICPITATREGTFHSSAHATNTLRPLTGTLVRQKIPGVNFASPSREVGGVARRSQV